MTLARQISGFVPHLDSCSDAPAKSDSQCWSTELPKDVEKNKAANQIFNPSQSSTFKSVSGSTWQISYGDGSSASGNVGTDHVTVGGLVIRGQTVELANQLSQQFVTDASSGLLGLAFGNINQVKPHPVPTPVQSMINQDDIHPSQEIFTAYLTSFKNPDERPFYTFGYIDKPTIQACGQEIAWAPVNSKQGFWMFQSESATVNGQQVPRSGNNAIADTGTSLCLVSDDLCQAVYQQVEGAQVDNNQGGWVFPTPSDINSLPTVTIAVGGQQITIQKEDMIYGEPSGGTCFGGIQSRGQTPFDILGDVFLRAVYAVRPMSLCLDIIPN